MNRVRPLSPSGWLTSGLLLLTLTSGLLSLALTCSAQLLPIRNYTIKEGLSSNNIYAVLRDTKGILWVGTNNGVSCYDGDRFFQPPMNTRTGQIYVTNFYEDHEHNIWVTSWYNGLYRYKDGDFVNYLPDSAHLEAQANNTFDMVEWSPGRYIVATDKNVWLFDNDPAGPDNDSSSFRPKLPSSPQPTPPSSSRSTPPLSSPPRFSLLDSSNHSLEQQIGTVVLTPGGELLIGYGKGIAHYHLTGSAGSFPQSKGDPSRSPGVPSPSPGTPSQPRGVPSRRNEKKWVYAGMLWEGAYVNRIALLEDQAWLGSDGGLYYFPHFSGLLRDPAHTKPMLLYPASPPHPGRAATGIEVDRVYVDTEKNIWFTGGGGARKIPAGSYRGLTDDSVHLSGHPVPALTYRTYSRANGLPSDMIRALYSDPEGITWIGTEDGLARLRQEYYRFYPIQEEFRDALDQKEPAIIISIHDDRQGNLWMGSYDGLYQVKKKNPKTAPMPEITSLGKKKIGFVHCMIHDKQGRLWACTDGGILLIEGTPVIKDSMVARCAFADPDGKIWFGGSKGRVAWQQDGQFHLLKFTSPNDERIDGIYHDPKGFLWLGYALTGMRKLRIQGDSLQHVLEYTERTGYPNLRIRSVSSDGKGHLLVGTRTDGLYIIPIDGDSLADPIHITTTQGLSGNWVKASLVSAEGCYLATSNGLDLLEPAGDYHEARIHPIPFRNEQVPVELNTLFRQSDTIWLGTAKGLLQYELHQQGKNTIPPPACFMKLTINGRLDSSFRPFTQTSELPPLDYEQNNLAFDFAGLSFRDEDKVSYRYKMEGLDKDWSAPTSRRYVNYSHLSPGSYRLFVMARNDDGIWSTTPAAVSFRIDAPFWLQGWFIALCTISAATLVYLLYRYRLNQALKIERIRTKISTDLHDDIGSTLSSISIMSDMIMHSPHESRQQASPPAQASSQSQAPPPPQDSPSPQAPPGQAAPPDWQRMAGEIKDNSLSLMDKMDDIVWSINPRNDEVENLMARIQRFAAPLFEAKGIDYEITIENNIRRLKLSMEHRQHLYLIMKEAVNNLVKYSGAANAVIRARSVGGWLKVDVSDNGSGFDPESSHKGNGIVNMKSRAALMGASLDIDSIQGKGTTVMLMLKIS